MRLTSRILVCVALLLALGVAQISATASRRDLSALEIASDAELVSSTAEAETAAEARQDACASCRVHASQS
jgi:hypothetical protein